jgi:hypothetical protein
VAIVSEIAPSVDMGKVHLEALQRLANQRPQTIDVDPDKKQYGGVSGRLAFMRLHARTCGATNTKRFSLDT